jgi:hypothetical protein
LAASDPRSDRAARNEALFRRVNERVEDINEAFEPILEEAEFFCECADINCIEKIRMSLPEYEALREVSTHFAVRPGHVLPDDERVVEERAEYFVVEKLGQAGRRAAELDPRDPST